MFTIIGGDDHFDHILKYYVYPHRFKNWCNFFSVYLMELGIFNFG